MKANATGIKAADDMKGYYCGTCHDGKRTHGDRKIFPSCAPKTARADLKRCNRCHSKGETVPRDYNFATFVEKIPEGAVRKRGRLGEGGREGIIKPGDPIEGVSINGSPWPSRRISPSRRRSRRCRRSSSPTPTHRLERVRTVPPGDLRRQERQDEIHDVDIFEGRYCGACHISWPSRRPTASDATPSRCDIHAASPRVGYPPLHWRTGMTFPFPPRRRCSETS